MIKVDLITGFLGAGKTTFIREYAKYLIESGEKIAIIENDFGAVNIDMVLLQGLSGDNCNLEMIVGGDGQEAHKRRLRTKLISMGMSGYTRVIVEPSGIFDADEFFDVLYEEPLDRWYEIGSVIAIVDAQTTQLTEDSMQYIFMSEIAWAGKLVFSKIGEGTDISAIVDYINSTMGKFGCSARFDESRDIVAKSFDDLDEKDFMIMRDSGYRNASYTKLAAMETQYNPLFYFDVEMPKELLVSTVNSLFKDYKAGNVIRVKGFVKVGEATQLQINATREEIEITEGNSSRNVLIIIGEQLNKAYINNILRDYCTVTSL